MATKKKSATPILDVFEKNRHNLEGLSRKSKTWFEQQVLLLSKKRITPNQLMKSDASQLSATLMPGHMYTFFYDAKTKETLPYFDMFPMVLPYRKTKDGFYGLNIHYLPYHVRIKLLDNLLQFKSNDKMDETTRIRYSWAMIEGVTRFKIAQPCIKQYLFDHVESAFLRIPANNWATAALMPVERFSGAPKERVWRDSMRSIR